MTSEWRPVRLGELVSIKHGWPFKSSLFSPTLSGRPIVVAVGNFCYTGGFRFDDTNIKEYTGAYPLQYELRPGEILLVMTCQTEGGEILGLPATIPDDGRVYLHNQRLGKVEIKNAQEIDSRYLYWLFLTREFNKELCASATGTKIVHTAPSRIEAFQFFLPSISEQKEIAAVLDAIEAKIELNQQMNVNLEAMARVLYKSWFVDFDPFKDESSNLSGLSRELLDWQPLNRRENQLVSSRIGDIPQGWRISSLGEYLSIAETGGRPKGGVKGIVGGIVSIGAESIIGIGRFDFSKVKFVPRDFYDSMTKGRISDRDVLLYKDGGRPGEFEPHVSMFGDEFPFAQACINEHVYRLRTTPELNQPYLYFALESDRLKEEMRTKGTGVAIPGLNSSALRSLTFLIPPADVLASFSRMVTPWIDQILANANESRRLMETRDQLLPRLLSGELRMPNERD